MPTTMPKTGDVERAWHHIDADGRVLGRLAVEIAGLLRGKHKPSFSYHVDCGDHVVVTNAAKLVMTGDKAQNTLHYRHSGYPGGLTATRFSDDLATRPEEVLRRTVRGMLPKNRLARKQLKHLKIYAGAEHPHDAQFRGTPGAPNSRRDEKTARKEAKRDAQRAARAEDAAAASAAAAAEEESVTATTSDETAEETDVEETAVAEAAVTETTEETETAEASADETPAADATADESPEDAPEDETAATSDEDATDETPEA